MWTIETLDSKNDLTILSVKTLGAREILVGRKVDCDVSLPDDRSISRKHAEIHVGHDVVHIKDLKSTFGTHIDGQQIPPNELYEIREGSVIKFGNESTYCRIRKCNLRFCATRLDKTEKDKIKAFCKDIGAVMVKNVEDCSHVLCTKFSATVKTLTAIVMRKPVVTLNWVEFIANPSAKSVDFLNTSEFWPPASDTRYSARLMTASREFLMKDTVVFLSHAADEQYRNIITHCGAAVQAVHGEAGAPEMEAAARRAMRVIASHIQVCIFVDDGRGIDQTALRLVNNLGVGFVESGVLANAILQNEPPLLTTSDMLSQRAQSQLQQHSQSLFSQPFVDVPAQESAGTDGMLRTTTLVATEEIGQSKFDASILNADKEAKRKAMEEQARLENEAKRKAMEEQARLENEAKRKAMEEQARLENEAKRKAMEEQARLENEAKRKAMEEQAKKQVKLQGGTDCAYSEKPDNRGARKRKTADFEQCTKDMDSAVGAAGTPLKRSRCASAADSVVHTAAIDSVFCISESRSSLKLHTSDGWMEPRRGQLVKRVAKDGDADGIAAVRQSDVDDNDCNTYTQPAVVEKVFRLRLSAAPSSSSAPSSNGRSSAGSNSSNSGDKRCFRKNLVRSLARAAYGDGELGCVGGMGTGRDVIRMGDMIRVLPKESEREVLLRATYEEERQNADAKDALFSDRFLKQQPKKTGAARSRFGN